MSAGTPTTVPASAVELLSAMVRLDTVNTVVSGDPLAEQKLCEHNEAAAQAMGFTTRRLPTKDRADNLLVTYEAGTAGGTGGDRPWIMFESHMDTVTVEGMTINPFGGEVRDGRVWGRGACDTKATGAAMLWAMHEYSKLAANEQPNNIALAYTIDEEVGTQGIKAVVNDHWSSLRFEPVGIVIGEPTKSQLITAHNGVVRWLVSTHGTACHSCEPWNGRSAISAMCRFVDRWERTYVPSVTATHPLTGRAASSVNIIQGGSQINVIPERCEVRIDRRVVPGESVEAIEKDPELILAELAAEDETFHGECELLSGIPPVSPGGSEPFITTIQRALETVGLSSEPGGAPYGTDGGVTSRAGIPTVIFGPGDIAQAHTKDEFIDIEQLEHGVEAYLAMMKQN